jgi:kinetochore protein Mis18
MEVVAEDSLLVSLCACCPCPLSWVACQEDCNCILLRCVSSDVSVDQEQKLSKHKDEENCLLKTVLYGLHPQT